MTHGVSHMMSVTWSLLHREHIFPDGSRRKFRINLVDFEAILVDFEAIF